MYNPHARLSQLLTKTTGNAITLNRYAYANNNPVSFVDPLGLSAENWIKAGVGIAIIGALVVIASVATAGTATAVLASAALTGAVVGGTSGMAVGYISSGGDVDDAVNGFLTGTIAGGASGALGAVTTSTSTVLAGNAVINAGEAVMNDALTDGVDSDTLVNMAVSAGVGTVFDVYHLNIEGSKLPNEQTDYDLWEDLYDSAFEDRVKSSAQIVSVRDTRK